MSYENPYASWSLKKVDGGIEGLKIFQRRQQPSSPQGIHVTWAVTEKRYSI